MAFAVVLGHVNTRIILTLLYYLVMTPVGLVMRLFRDPLNRSLDDQTAERLGPARARSPVDPKRYERQF